ncbi:MAG: hypothetical protein NTV70_18170 [Acidobacteria bacterium]|nr:hypothetical protein [Acidobacteriota bacterium]
MPGEVKAILRVSDADYVPPGVTVRARIDATLFTASFADELLETLRQDSKVVSIEVSQRLRQID